MLIDNIKYRFYTCPLIPKPTWVNKTTDPLKMVKSTSILMLGDSTTAYVDYHRFPNVVNHGIGGDTSSGVLDRVGVAIVPQPRVICLGIGANDLQIGQLDKNKEWFYKWQKNYIGILQKIKFNSPNSQIILSTPLPVDQRFEKYGTTMKDGLLLLRQSVMGLGIFGFEVVDLHSAFVQSNGYVTSGIFPDLIHPTTEKAQNIIKITYGTLLI